MHLCVNSNIQVERNNVQNFLGIHTILNLRILFVSNVHTGCGGIKAYMHVSRKCTIHPLAKNKDTKDTLNI